MSSWPKDLEAAERIVRTGEAAVERQRQLVEGARDPRLAALGRRLLLKMERSLELQRDILARVRGKYDGSSADGDSGLIR